MAVRISLAHRTCRCARNARYFVSCTTAGYEIYRIFKTVHWRGPPSLRFYGVERNRP